MLQKDEQAAEAGSALPPALKRFKFLSERLTTGAAATNTSSQVDTTESRLNKYLVEIHDIRTAEPLTFWSQRRPPAAIFLH